LLYNINPSWLVRINEDVKVKFLASASTAYITPSLYQLHTTWGGNPDLKPEEDFNVEYGATFYLKDKIQFTAVNYYRTEENAIIYSSLFQYENTNRNRYVDGVTIDETWNVIKQLKLRADYAYTQTNLSNTFYRIPAHKAGASVMYQPREGSGISVHYQYTGERTEPMYPADLVLDSFSLVDITASQKFLKDKLSAYLAVANVFDQDFTGVYGYTTRGRNFTAGLKFNF
jgi:vitamin B12 transporter